MTRKSVAYLPFAIAILGFAFFGGYLNRHLQVQSASITWDGGGADSNWATAANWAGDIVPGAADIAVFDGTSTKDVTIAANANVGGIDINSGYTGTITQAAGITLTVGTSGYAQDDGTFTGGDSTIDLNGDFTLAGGTFTSTSGSLNLSGNWTHTAGGTFNHNSGTWRFDGSASKAVDVNGTETFYDVVVNTGSNSTFLNIAAGDTLVTTNVLTLTNGSIGTGTIESQGTLSKASGFDGGDGIVHVTSDAVQALTWSGSMSGLYLDGENTTITASAVNSISFDGDLTIVNGSIDASALTSALWLYRDVSIEGGTLTLPAVETFTHGAWSKTGGTLNHSNGTVVFQTTGSIAINGSTTFYNLELKGTEDEEFILEAGQTQTIENQAIIGGNSPSVATGFHIPLKSSQPGVAANIDFQGPMALGHLEITDIANTSGTEVLCAARCVDNGGNSGIDFSRSMKIYTSDISGEVDESGATATFTVTMTSRPSADVVISVVSSDPGEATVSASELVFTSVNWEIPQTVTVTGVDDALNDGAVAVTITLGAASSADARYNGMSVRDVLVVNNDDETGVDTIEFDQAGSWEFEDVKASTGEEITYFEYDYYGQGRFYTDEGVDAVVLVDSKIRPGCFADIGGTNYTIVKVVDENIYGYTVVLTRGGLAPDELDAELNASSGVVNSIKCLTIAEGNLQLSKETINVTQVEAGGDWLAYDSANDQIWSPPGFSTSVNRFDLATGTVSTHTAGNGAIGVAYDSTRDHIWVSNRSADTVTVFESSDGSYALGTFAASTFSVSDAPYRLEYDPVNDAIWVAHMDNSNHKVSHINAVDGSLIGSYSVPSRTYDLAYDSTNDSIWVIGNTEVVEFNASNGAYKNGTLENSTYLVPMTSSLAAIAYDAANDAVWIVDQLLSDIGFIVKLDAADGTVLGAYEIGSGAYDVAIDATNNRAWVTNSNDMSWTVLDTTDGREIGEFTTNDCPTGIILDGDLDLWGTDCSNGMIDQVVYEGTPFGKYYTAITSASGDLDVSNVTSITSVDITETLSGEGAYYAVSFDGGLSYAVDGWRVIASSVSADHGGVEGAWYYRDNADTWTAVASNTAQEAISAAVEAGANNRMVSADIEALDAADWAAEGGFDANTSETLDLAVTVYSSDVHITPSVQNVTFTMVSEEGEDGGDGGDGGGGGGGVSQDDPVATSNTSIEVSACTDAREIWVNLQGSDISGYLLSESESFVGTDWKVFSSEGNPVAIANGKAIHSMAVPFTLSEHDGVKKLYAKFRSSNMNQSGTLSAVIELAQAEGCGSEIPSDPEPLPDDADGAEDTDDVSPAPVALGCMGIPRTISDAERQNYRFGVSPVRGKYATAEMIQPGDYVRSISTDTVYCVDENRHRKPFIDETSYFTHERSFDKVRWVTDEALASLELDEAMLPNPQTVLVKFESDAQVYMFVEGTTNTLARIMTEELAKEMVGEDWADYVIDLNPALQVNFEFSAPILEAVEIDTSRLRKRELLNEAHASKHVVQSALRFFKGLFN